MIADAKEIFIIIVVDNWTSLGNQVKGGEVSTIQIKI